MRIKFTKHRFRLTLSLLFAVSLAAGLWYGRSLWQPYSQIIMQRWLGSSVVAIAEQAELPPATEVQVLKLSEQARLNLGLRSSPTKPQSYWRTIEIPGVIADRPGITDSGVTSPISGVITKIHAMEGDVVRPGQRLVSVRLLSEYLQQAQLALFKANREIEILNAEIKRLRPLAESGGVPGSRIIELEQQISRQNSLIDGQRQDLLARGLDANQIAQIETGQFLTDINIDAPEPTTSSGEFTTVRFERNSNELIESDFFEVQSLRVSLGQQVDAGQMIAVLADHSTLYIKGIAFKKDSTSLARAAEHGWPLNIEFADDAARDWPSINQTFQIRHFANTSDSATRTFDFFVPLVNQFRSYESDNRLFVLWRYRPGQRVRIHVPVEELSNVVVLPTEAVVFEGPEAFVFQQNGDLFNRISVRVLHQDRLHVIIANDGAILPGYYLAQNAAASLNRVLKSQAASGMRADFHVHADGSIHAAH